MDCLLYTSGRTDGATAQDGFGKRFWQTGYIWLRECPKDLETRLGKYRLRAWAQYPCGTEQVPCEQAHDCERG